MHLEAGSRCPWCLNIVTEAALPPAAGHRDGEGAEALGALVARTALPVATLAAASVPEAGAVAPPEVAASTSGARTFDPDTAHEAAESITDRQRRAVYRAVLEALYEHGPSTDHDLARYVSGKLQHPIIQTSVGKRRGELRDSGQVTDSGFKGKTPSGARAIRWALTTAGESAVMAGAA